MFKCRPKLLLSTKIFGLALCVQAGSFSSDFNSGMPDHVKLLGHASVGQTGGVDDSGVLKLTVAKGAQMGSMIIDPLDGKQSVQSFTVNFKMLIGGGDGADGLGLCYLTRMSDNAFGEAHTGTGLAITFDTYKNSTEASPGVRIYSNKTVVASQILPELRNNRFVDVMVKLNPGGTLDMSYDGQTLFSNLMVGATNLVGQFGFGSRTGSHKDNHFIDDLSIKTRTAIDAFIESFEPADENASPAPDIKVTFRETAKVFRKSIRLKLDGKLVPATVEMAGKALCVRYQPTDLLEPGSAHSVEMSFLDTASNKTINFAFSFKVSSQVGISK